MLLRLPIVRRREDTRFRYGNTVNTASDKKENAGEKFPKASSEAEAISLCACGEATMKRFCLNDEEVELRPANSRMEPLHIPAGDAEILGTVVGLLRHYRQRPPYTS
jgi:hypothetical protein